MPKDLESDTGEIPLVDDLESDHAEADDSEIPLADIAPKAAAAPIEPLRRLWKHEPDEAEQAELEAEKEKRKKKEAAAAEIAPMRAAYHDPAARPKKSEKVEKTKVRSKSKAALKEGDGTKKAIIEETPALDTYESRQRARMIVSGLLVLIMAMVMWSVYRAFFHSTGSVEVPGDDIGAMALAAPEPKASLDQEAHFMLARAEESAKQKRTDQAVAMLNRIVKVYPKTAAGREAQAALDRPKRGLPVFLDRPAVVAVPEKTVAATKPVLPAAPIATVTAPAPPTAPPPSMAPAPPPPTAPIVNAVVATDKSVQSQTQGRSPVQGRTPAGSMPAQPGLPPTAAMVTPPPPQSTVVAKAEIPGKPRGVAARELPNGFHAISDAGYHESGWANMIAGDHDLAPMVLVPGATFTMGNDRGEPIEAPAHPVRLSTYYIDQHEVTCGQFRNYLSKELRNKIGSSKWFNDPKFKASPEMAAMVMVNYREADNYALWAGKRLPTEAQWEMAGRSYESRRYPWGDDAPRWSRPRQPQQITEVKAYPEDESIYGAFDLAGNAAEWVRDWWDPQYFAKTANKVSEDPSGPTKAYGLSILRMVKGGSKNWTLSARKSVELDKRLPYLGFRCVLAVEGPDAPASIVAHPPVNPAATLPGQGTAPGAAQIPF